MLCLAVQGVPRIVVSKCLEFEHCRYDGEIIASEAVRAMKPLVEFLPVCPEMQIGLGVPRDPIQIEFDGGRRRLVQPATGRDLTELMEDFCTRFLGSVGTVDGFILKSRSPSCGLKGVKIFSPDDKSGSSAPGSGFFAEAVRQRFPELPLEDEEGLLDLAGREHFLKRVFTAVLFRTSRRWTPMDLMFLAENGIQDATAF
jgi:uncharacterized protein YbbK (DUF523 family)